MLIFYTRDTKNADKEEKKFALQIAIVVIAFSIYL